MALIVFVIVWVVLEQTAFGRRLYAIGGNVEAARLGGVRVRLLRLIAFVLTGVGAAVVCGAVRTPSGRLSSARVATARRGRLRNRALSATSRAARPKTARVRPALRRRIPPRRRPAAGPGPAPGRCSR